jgi:peptide/nickel transport system substrate-binding protein
MSGRKRKASGLWKITRREFLKGSVLGAVGTMLAACMPSAEPTPSPEVAPTPTPKPPVPTPIPTVPKAQEAKFLVGQNFFGDMNPYSNWITASAEVTHHIYDPLVKWDETQGNILGDLAESWEVVDPNTWLFNLKQGVTFHDGTEFTADSVKYSLEEIQVGEYGMAFSTLFVTPMEIEVVDKYTAKVTTEDPFSALLPNLTIVGMLNPAQTKEEIDVAPIGTGPFKFVSREGNTIAVEAHEDYWRGAPQLSQIAFEYVEDPTTRIVALRGGEAQIAERIPVDRVQELEDDPATKVIVAPTNETTRWTGITDRFPWDDIKFREAFWHAVDRQELIDSFLEGLFPAATAHCAKSVFGYPPDLKEIPYDPELAKRLLDESTYAGEELEFVGPAGYHPKNAEIMQAVADLAAPVGFNIRANPMEVGAFIDRIRSEDFNGISYSSWVSWTGDADFVIGFLYTPATWAHWSDPVTQETFEASRQEFDPEKRRAKLQECFKSIWDGYMSVSFYETVQVVAMAQNLENWPTPPTMLLVAEPDTYLS